jgi:dienelactone hydrolase
MPARGEAQLQVQKAEGLPFQGFRDTMIRMPNYIYCPECDHKIPLGSVDGPRRKVRCPVCGAQVRSAYGVDEDYDDDDRPRPRRRPPPRSQAKIWLIVGGVVVGLIILGCGGIFFLGWRAFQPTSFPEQTEDYVQARSHFQTKLLKQGAAPQPFDPVVLPPGVDEVEYTSGNLKLKAWVTHPEPRAARKPAVLFLHGGFAFGEDDWDMTRPFQDAGYVVMTPMLRGENGLPGSYSMFYNEVDDVVAAADSFAKMPHVDSKRMYIAGHSVGGTITLLTAMTSNRFRAAASYSGSTDQVVWARAEGDEVVPFDKSNKLEFQMRSPLAYPRSFKCPVRMFYGSQEIGFASGCKKTAELAKKANLDVEAVQVPGDHFSAVDPAMRQTIMFFNAK